MSPRAHRLCPGPARSLNVMVIVRAGGDLTTRRLVPSLLSHLCMARLLPDRFAESTHPGAESRPSYFPVRRRSLPPDSSHRRNLTLGDQIRASGDSPSDACAFASESSISASCSGR